MTRRKGLPLIDLLPEQVLYRDDGCDVSSSCLRCPLPRCKYDTDDEGNRNWLQREAKDKRDRKVMKVRNQEGKTIPQLAKRFGLSKRTIHRIIRRVNGNLEE